MAMIKVAGSACRAAAGCAVGPPPVAATGAATPTAAAPRNKERRLRRLETPRSNAVGTAGAGWDGHIGMLLSGVMGGIDREQVRAS